MEGEQLKRESHHRLLLQVLRSRNGKILAQKKYSNKDEFRTLQVARMHKV